MHRIKDPGTNPLENSRACCSDARAMMTYVEIESFFTGLIATAQARGITCAITSGMACVHYGVAATTKDCDVLCACASADKFLDLIDETPVRGLRATYRGHLSPPLDARWLRGGWTAHFTWKVPPDEVHLDIFGVAPRASTAWERELDGLYASRRIVAEMKRTNRGKDWPFITALGVKMLNAGLSDGWLHLYSPEVMRDNLRRRPPPEPVVERRPALRLLLAGDGQLDAAIEAEQVFWHRLDACRIRIYERALRPYVSAVRRATARRTLSLPEAHALRLECAGLHLRREPLREHGFERLIEDARASAAERIHPALIKWLPDVRAHFIFNP